jgi:hypothetical protein
MLELVIDISLHIQTYNRTHFQMYDQLLILYFTPHQNLQLTLHPFSIFLGKSNIHTVHSSDCCYITTRPNRSNSTTGKYYTYFHHIDGHCIILILNIFLLQYLFYKEQQNHTDESDPKLSPLQSLLKWLVAQIYNSPFVSAHLFSVNLSLHS